MPRGACTALLLVLVIASVSCSRTKEDVTVNRHRVDTEFIVE